MKKLVIGILAHVDAGKTTLSESLLYLSGRIRKPGRVDNKDAYLDNYELERARGITIFSKQAVFAIKYLHGSLGIPDTKCIDGSNGWSDLQITLLDTPGHIDFSAEMERTMKVLDYAILVVSGSDGIQGHTATLWRLFEIYRIPVFVFINKMDQNGADREKLLTELKRRFGDGCVDFRYGTAGQSTYELNEQLAMCDETLMDVFLKYGKIETSHIQQAIIKRKVFPCFFGSALKQDGVNELMEGISKYCTPPTYPEAFAARVYKITRDDQGNRLTHIKITGGSLKVRDVLKGECWEEKVNQIRIYSGQKFNAVNEVPAGTVCSVTGLSRTKPGEVLGEEKETKVPLLEPVLNYRILLPDGCDPRVILPKLRQLEEEGPELNIVWDEQSKEIQVHVMGEVQLEVLQSIVNSRFGVEIGFDSGRIVYKETIEDIVEGVGHFEPLRHYAEVHLLLEPGERGSGLVFSEDCSEDILGKSWKNLVCSHLVEKLHKGVLTGSVITDMKITLVSGRAHSKHTQGGDFREATWRAVRQGLKSAKSVLLEPFYTFFLELPEKMVGRAMTDIDKMHGLCRLTQINGVIAVLEGKAPVITMKNYQKEVTAYTKGEGRIFFSLAGYEPCHNPEEVIGAIGYDSERDLQNPAGSVFCANGAGFAVEWYEVKNHMHVESWLQERNREGQKTEKHRERSFSNKNNSKEEEKWMDEKEVDRIFKQTFYANQGKKSVFKSLKKQAAWKLMPSSLAERVGKVEGTIGISKNERRKIEPKREEYLLVDGYNIIFAWPDLKDLAAGSLDGARCRLLNQLEKYHGVTGCQVIAVFDAYRVQGHREETIEYGSIHVVYTKEAQTADHFIERFTHINQGKYNISVATSDRLQQMIIRGSGCTAVSAEELKKEMDRVDEKAMRTISEKYGAVRYRIKDSIAARTLEKMHKYLD